MNKKLIIICFWLCKTGVVFGMSDSGVDLNKINGSQVVEKTVFTSIEANMKSMEDNILKLMRELGELKMQMHELKISAKKELDAQQRIIEPQKQEIKTSQSPEPQDSSQDIVVTITTTN
jgi:hypothetical protein